MEIIIVDRDLPFACRLEKMILQMGHGSIRFDGCAQARERAYSGQCDLLVVNIDNDGGAASKFIELFSRMHHAPVIVTSVNAEIACKIHHLNIGAVDYVVKPVDFEEFMARVALQLGRRTAPVEIASKLDFGDLVINLSNSSVERGGRTIPLTPQEFATLLCLARQRGQPVSRQQLLDKVWGPGHALRANVINVAMGRLRRKIDAAFDRKFIHTIHGTGYAAGYRD